MPAAGGTGSPPSRCSRERPSFAGYALLGSTWLVMKSSGPLQDRAFVLARILALATVGAIAAVSLATPFLEGAYWRNWFAWPRVVLVAPVPLAVAACAVFLVRTLALRRDGWPFVLSLALFALSFVGLGVSMFPYVIPGSVTIWQAAAPDKSLAFILVGVSILIPVILAYSAYAYWIFRGKIDVDAGYH